MPEYNYGESFGECPYCKAKMVKNPKTGKIFCEQKCWLKRGVVSDQGVGAKNASGGIVGASRIPLAESLRNGAKRSRKSQKTGAERPLWSILPRSDSRSLPGLLHLRNFRKNRRRNQPVHRRLAIHSLQI